MRVLSIAASAVVAMGSLMPGFVGAQQVSDGSVSGKTFSSDSLKLKFSWTLAMNQQDPASALRSGQLNVPGLQPPDSTSAPGSVTSCLRPVLFLKTPEAEHPDVNNNKKSSGPGKPYATMLLAEIVSTCLSPAAQATNGPDLPAFDKLLLGAPGMTLASGPATYTVGGHKVTMVPAQGHPSAAASGSGNQSDTLPFTLYTMAVATTWDNHMLVWLMTANTVGRLDELSKSQVQFGTAAPAQLYPQHLSKSGAIGPPPRE